MVEATLPQARCDFYVYVIFRPNGVPCYVGKGKGGRWKQHIVKSHNPRLRNIVAKAEREGKDIPILKIQEGLTDVRACFVEKAFIAAIGRNDLGLGPLLNLTDGGDGLSGFIRDRESVIRTAQFHTGRKRTEKTCENIKAALADPTVYAKLGVQNRGRALSPSARMRISKTLTGRPSPKPAGFGATISAVMMGKKKSPIHRAALSKAKKGRPGWIPNEATRAKRSATLTGRKRAPFSLDWRNNMAAAQRNRHARIRADMERSGITIVRKPTKPRSKALYSREDRSARQSLRNLGNQYGLGNKRTASGQAIVTVSVVESNKRRNKSGKPTIHKGPTPWLDAGLSRTEWYRRRKNMGHQNERDGGCRAD